MQQAVRSGRVDLRKIAGEVNPADLFTKHSLSRDRLMSLTGLFDCEFRGGRAASAPKTRTAASSKTTMAEANAVVDEQRAGNTVGGTLDTKHPGCSCEEPQLLCLPHIQYSIEEMDALYPPFIAPPAVDAGDPHSDAHETLLHEGYRLAKEIAHDASIQGRRKQMR